MTTASKNQQQLHQTVDSVMASINKTDAHLESVKAKFFEVVKVPLKPKSTKFEATENVFGVYKSTGGQPISKKSMGKDFMPMQPNEFFENILQTANECNGEMNLDTLKFNEYSGGSKIEFSVEMNPIEFVNDKKVKDITKVFMTFTTSYDGSKSNTISIYTERLVCTNGMVARGLEGVLKGRNTIGGKTKILSYCEEVAELLTNVQDYKKRLEELNKKRVTPAQVEAFKLSLLGYNAETLAQAEIENPKNQNTRKHEILKNLDEAIKLEFDRTGKTAFGLLQGVTYYTNHIASEKVATASKGIAIQRPEYIRFFQGAKTNDTAQELVFAMLN